MITRAVIVVLVALGYFQAVKAQTFSNPSNLQLTLEPVSQPQMSDNSLDNINDPMSMIAPNSQMKLNAFFKVDSIANIHEVKIKVGTTAGGNDLKELTFVFDDTSIAAPLCFERTGNNIKLCLGTISMTPDLYAELLLEDIDNAASTTATYSSGN